MNTKLVSGWIVIQTRHPVQTNETRLPPPKDTLGAGVKVVVHGAVPGSPGWPGGLLSPTAASIGNLAAAAPA